jgi:hypothetical protein
LRIPNYHFRILKLNLRRIRLALKDVALRSAAPASAPTTAPARAPAAPQQPITLSRNGKDFKITANQSTVRAGKEIRVKTERPELAISLSEMAKDSWGVFKLPGFANAASGKQQDSLVALRKATETSYFKGPDALWVKLVIPTAPKGMGMDQFGPSGTQAQHYGEPISKTGALPREQQHQQAKLQVNQRAQQRADTSGSATQWENATSDCF